VIVAHGRRIRRQEEKASFVGKQKLSCREGTESFAVRDMAYQRRIGASFA
jgi:hypothetical protein